MAHGSYLLKRDGRFYLQVRKGHFWGKLTKRQLYRRSLQTSDVREARVAITPYLDWIWQVSTIDIISADALLHRFNDLMMGYLNFPVASDPKQLRAREDLEREILLCRKNIKNEMGVHAVNAMCPGFEETWKDFVFANAHYRSIQDEKHCEIGKSDMSVFEASAQPCVKFAGVQHAGPVRDLTKIDPRWPEVDYDEYLAAGGDPLDFGEDEQAHSATEIESERPDASAFANARSDRPKAFPANEPLRIEPTLGVNQTILSLNNGNFGNANDEASRQPDEGQFKSAAEKPDPAGTECVATVPVAEPTAPSSGLCLSEAVERCLAEELKKKGNDRQRETVGPVSKFMIWYFGDAEVNSITPDMIEAFVELLPLVPIAHSVPPKYQGSFALRYEYGQQEVEQNGVSVKRIDNLQRWVKKTIDSSHLGGIRKVFNYVKKREGWPYDVPTLGVYCGELMTSLPRDAFDEEEIIKIVTQPLFTGCKSLRRIWTKGEYFVQNGFYWCFLIGLLTGMRPGEAAQLACEDLKIKKGVWYFDLRTFNHEAGRVMIKEQKTLKTKGSARIVPIPPLLIALGILDHRDELAALNCPRLFPDVHPLVRKSGAIRWSHKLSKCFGNLKSKIGLTRADICLYSSRHSFADILDDMVLSDRQRARLLGNNNSVANEYGRKSSFSTKQLAAMEDSNTDLILRISEPLLAAKERADNGELTIIKQWLTMSNWAPIDQAKHAAIVNAQSDTNQS